MFLIAESGSTKTDWLLSNGREVISLVKTAGINPYYIDLGGIVKLLSEELLPQLSADVDEVFFYGAGCTPGEKSDLVKTALEQCFPQAKVQVLSDMWAACRGLCGTNSGIVCILGTGSNSCLYNGGQIEKNVPPLGFILGDEGSGASLGKALVADYLKGLMPAELAAQFKNRYAVEAAEVLDNVYRRPFANRYLASFALFAGHNEDTPYIKALLKNEFGKFVDRVLSQYPKNLNVCFTGSVAWSLKNSLLEVCTSAGYHISKIEQSPLMGLVNFHSGLQQ